VSDLTDLAAHALQRAGDPDCPVPEASLWLGIATDIEDYVQPDDDQDHLFTETQGATP